tara:strand:- start:5682 stop:8675 length:2994 start_codon:yes stop_codon:yes gene_type:complete
MKFLDIFYNNKIVKSIVVYNVFILIFYIVSSKINSIIIKYLTIDESALIQIPKSLIIGIFIITHVYIIYELILKNYQLSFGIKHLIFSSVIIYLILRFTNYRIGWYFIAYNETSLNYIDLIGIPLFLTCFIIIIKFLINTFFKEKLLISKSPFVSDDPILNKDGDKLNYEKRASDILAYLKRSSFKNSFTIGIVGPWGNGKSSLIGLMEEDLRENPLNSTINLKFLPYLNHSETDIISEFFRQLSAEISKYSGSLSSQFLNYSDKLLKLYKNKNITEFLKPNSNLLSRESSYATYERINDSLKKINKKFIIFIDDLDRLSNKEVLQVLKLVRNTANFKNFIFLIALDKDYVLESLIAKNDIADHVFVDKFFQLEVYLPEIEKSQLKKDFIELLKKTDLENKPNLILDIETSIYRQDNLFDDYISNHRGVKRLVNQLVFDYHSLPDELNTNDFLNFTYLKMAFPFAIKFLNRNWSKVIPFNPETNLCELIESVDDTDNSSNAIMKDIRTYFANPNLNIDYDKYEISKGISEKKQISETNNLSKQQNILLAKTLIVLFGKENTTDSHTSIKFENNLRKLLQQKIHDNDLSEKEFMGVFNFENDYSCLKHLLNESHCSNILNRIAYFNTDDKQKTLKTLIILLYIFNNAENYGTYFNNVWNILSDFINRQLKLKQDGIEVWKEIDKPQIWEYIEEVFLNKDYKLVRKIEFLSLISQHRIKLSFSDWGTSEEELKTIIFSLYEELLESKQDNLWDIYDYTFYHAYHNVRKFHVPAKINPITIEFWRKNDIRLLCAQMTVNDTWTTKMLQTSDYTVQLFGSKNDYKKFIFNNLPEPISLELQEYIHFLELESYTRFSNYIRFEFSYFDLINQKLQRVIDSNNLKRDDFESVVEIILKSETKDLWGITHTDLENNTISGFIFARRYEVENRYYTFVRLKTDTFHRAIPELFEHYQKLLKVKDIDSKISSDNKLLTLDSSLEKIEIISIQPTSYSKKGKPKIKE